MFTCYEPPTQLCYTYRVNHRETASDRNELRLSGWRVTEFSRFFSTNAGLGLDWGWGRPNGSDNTTETDSDSDEDGSEACEMEPGFPLGFNMNASGSWQATRTSTAKERSKAKWIQMQKDQAKQRKVEQQAAQNGGKKLIVNPGKVNSV